MKRLNRNSMRNAKCDYCGEPPVAGSASYGLETLRNQVHFWCEHCEHDLTGFRAKPENALPEDIDFDDEEAVKRLSLQLHGIQRRQDEFMRRKVAERRGPA
jgi:hypothetical protein